MRDLDTLRAIRDSLNTLGIFAGCELSRLVPRSLNAGSFPFCWIEPKGWTQKPEKECPDVLREVRFDCRLFCGPGSSDVDDLDRLEALVDALVDALAGLELPGLLGVRTSVAAAEYGGHWPEADAVLHMSFQFLPTYHDEDPPPQGEPI